MIQHSGTVVQLFGVSLIQSACPVAPQGEAAETR